MKLEIKSISFSNIMSFGMVPTTIEFNQGTTLWSGANGQGKSSALLDTLSYCLYGKPYRKVKLEELINRRNKGNLKTKCVFSIGDDIYSLTRNKSPDVLELTKNGNEVDLLSSKKLTQVEIDKVLGVSYEIFKQTISIAISYNRPFLVLDAKEKRKTIECMFGISEFAKMNKVLSEKNKASKRAFDILENNINNINSTISLFEKQIVDLEEQNKNFERLNRQKIDKHESEIISDQKILDKYIAEATSIEEEVTKLNEKITTLNKSKYTTALTKLQKQQSECEWNIKTLTTQIKKLTTETICPTCKTPFPEEKRLAEIAEKQKQKEEAEKSLSDVNSKITILNDNISTIEQKETALSTAEKNLQKIQIQIRDAQKSIKFHEYQITELKGVKNEIDVDKIRKQVIQKQSELSENTARKDIEDRNIQNYKVVDKVLSDEGARSYIIDKIYPLLNKKILEYLDLFELQIRLTFDRQMEEKIISLEHFKQEISYMSMSEGEKRRIDIAIMLSLIDVMKVISNWGCNILIIDELLDGATDINGLEQMLLAMKKMSDEKKMNISIISHRLNDNFSHMFDKKIYVSKNIHGFSELKYE